MATRPGKKKRNKKQVKAAGIKPRKADTQRKQQPAALKPLVMPALCEFIAGSQSARWPEQAYDLAKRHILDTLASIVVCRDLRPSVLARNFALAQSGGAQRNAATILGTHERAALNDAVFASAMTGHGSEINDFCPSAFVQPGPPIVSAAMGLAELRGKSGEAVLRSVITGYEIACRIPKALGVENLRRMHIANHGIGPVFGVGAAAASIMGLSREQVADAISYCSQLASGSWQWLLDIEHIEKAYVFAGMGAQNGLQAALLVEAGFTGVAANLDHPGGWMNSYMFTAPGSDHDRSYLIKDLGKRFELPLVAYKRYPVGGPTQPTVHALLGLVSKVDYREVEHVRIEMPGLHVEAFQNAAMPALSLPYLTSIILIDGRLEFDMVDSRQRFSTDPVVRELMRKVKVEHDPKQTHKPGTPRTESARVTITMCDGNQHQVFVGHVPGFPSHPMSRADVEEKAFSLMAPKLGDSRARAVIDKVAHIEQLGQAAELAAMIAV